MKKPAKPRAKRKPTLDRTLELLANELSETATLRDEVAALRERLEFSEQNCARLQSLVPSLLSQVNTDKGLAEFGSLIERLATIATGTESYLEDMNVLRHQMAEALRKPVAT